VEDQIKEGTEGFAGWSIIASWDPEMRYSLQKINKVELLLEAAETLLGKL
jgi:hypothetical protein